MKVKYGTMTTPELIAKHDELKKKYFDFRFQAVIGHVENPLMKRTLRKDIARVKTILRQREIAEAAKAPSAAK